MRVRPAVVGKNAKTHDTDRDLLSRLEMECRRLGLRTCHNNRLAAVRRKTNADPFKGPDEAHFFDYPVGQFLIILHQIFRSPQEYIFGPDDELRGLAVGQRILRTDVQ